MTDKELKKLSRLELLELLLTESRENERLREELERVKKENTVEKSAQHLNETSKQLDSALQKVSSILTVSAVKAETAENKQTVETSVTQIRAEQTDSQEQKANSVYKSVDYNIYKNLMVFFIKNPYSLAVLPDDLRKEITDRIDNIRSRLRQKADK